MKTSHTVHNQSTKICCFFREMEFCTDKKPDKRNPT